MEQSQALAYTTIAMSRLGYSKREIEKVTNEMLADFKVYAEDEIERLADEILFQQP
ncbi:hypothetical protein LS684_13855 [Cytobacillus spongiae]|uniref:hypothetical protein n=1 Tax=Cytobacillus spongiae TaxID=2901381 RepID=UPI001F15CF2F|nr:hypothetical protein [Cytobacillus spongiae]UII54742.1 hypothetical protein LS684_13855 [Cytobacillus spongiae]